MSIELAATEVVTPGALAFLAVMAVVTLSILRGVGFFSPRDELSLSQLAPREPIAPLMKNAGIAVLVYFGLAVVIGLVLRKVSPGVVEESKDDGLPPALLIMFSCVIPLACMVWLLVGLKVVVPNGFMRVGLAGRPIVTAALAAVGILAAALPAIFLASNLTELIYQRLGWTHDSAHELLKSMSEVNSVGEKVLAIIAAVIIAPLNEELLFRGHLQAGLRRLLMPRPALLLAEAVAVAGDPSLMPPPLPEVQAVEPMPGDQPVVATVAPPIPVQPLDYQTPRVGNARTLLASGLAIVITSLIFASIHPSWSRGTIFVLSVFLGIAYERRGNLWTSIFIHALFNGSMITLFLLTQQH